MLLFINVSSVTFLAGTVLYPSNGISYSVPVLQKSRYSKFMKFLQKNNNKSIYIDKKMFRKYEPSNIFDGGIGSLQAGKIWRKKCKERCNKYTHIAFNFEEH